jgi:hypothetical protein
VADSDVPGIAVPEIATRGRRPATRRTLGIVLAYVAVLYVHGLAIATGEARAQCATGRPLYDVIHDLQARGSGWVSWFASVNNDLIIALLSLTIIWAIVVSPQRQLILRRFIVFHAMLAMIRAVSIWVTTIPSPNPLCRDRFMEANPFERAITLSVDAVGLHHEWFGLGAGGNTCCDIIISGHAAILVVDAMLIGMIFRSRGIRLTAWALALLGLIGTITPDRHYAVEVFLTAAVGVPLLAWYHLRARAPGPVLRWLEQPATLGPWTSR